MNTEKRDPMDGDYVGNVFGWRISIIGAIVIGGILLFAVFNHWYYDIPLGMEDPTGLEKTETKVDTLQ